MKVDDCKKYVRDRVKLVEKLETRLSRLSSREFCLNLEFVVRFAQFNQNKPMTATVYTHATRLDRATPEKLFVVLVRLDHHTMLGLMGDYFVLNYRYLAPARCHDLNQIQSAIVHQKLSETTIFKHENFKWPVLPASAKGEFTFPAVKFLKSVEWVKYETIIRDGDYEDALINALYVLEAVRIMNEVDDLCRQSAMTLRESKWIFALDTHRMRTLVFGMNFSGTLKLHQTSGLLGSIDLRNGGVVLSFASDHGTFAVNLIEKTVNILNLRENAEYPCTDD